MQTPQEKPALRFDDPKLVAVERGITEFRAGRPVLMAEGGETFLVLPVDGLDAEPLSKFLSLCKLSLPKLVITCRRARSIGIDVNEPVTLLLPSADIRTVLSLVTDARPDVSYKMETPAPALRAALDLAKFAHRLPAVLAMPGQVVESATFDPPLVTVSADAVATFRQAATQSLRITGDARVPLEGGVRSRFVIFRSVLGDSAAVIVGQPDFSNPVPVRLHSACLTGDVFGSRRCDCGDQLRLALSELAAADGGIILYLDQEGRGLGLANKMRAYRLQDQGFDTVDANMSLGFDDDERDYGIAGQMLKMLGCTRVQLFTNNPAKVKGLTQAGIEISERMPLLAPVNVDNRRYLTTKAMRAGHSLDYLLESVAEDVREDTTIRG